MNRKRGKAIYFVVKIKNCFTVILRKVFVSLRCLMMLALSRPDTNLFGVGFGFIVVVASADANYAATFLIVVDHEARMAGHNVIVARIAADAAKEFYTHILFLMFIYLL